MKKLLYICSLAIGLSFSSCNDFLEVEPTDAVSEDIIFSTTQTIDANMVGIYNAMVYYYGIEGHRWILGPDVMVNDIFVRSTNNYGRFSTQIYPLAFTDENSRTTELWTRSYRVIKSANDVINKVDDVTGTEEEKASLKAEALTIRAYTYLKLVRLYGEEAYSQNPDAKGLVLDLISDPTEVIGRSSVKDVYEAVISDLETAIALFPSEENASSKKWRLDKRAANATLANAYLDTEEWAKAKSAAQAARNGISDGSDLMSEAEYTEGFFNTVQETIWERAFVTGQTYSFLSLASFTYTDDDGEQGFVFGYNSLRTTQTFVDMFADTDYRKKLFPSNPADEGVYTTKYRHPEGSMATGRNIPRIRTSEMYLIEAECEAELNNTSEAQDILYVLQHKRDDSVEKSTNTGNTLMTEIIDERRKELFLEGHRLFTVKRKNLNFTRTDDAHWQLKGEEIKGSDYRLNMPLPISEVNANQGLTTADQNRGYVL